MAGGVPFRKGDDPRRNLRGHKTKPAKTIRALARKERENTVKRLVQLRDQKDDQPLALEACKFLAAYSDGAPGASNVPDEVDEDDEDGGEPVKYPLPVPDLPKPDAPESA